MYIKVWNKQSEINGIDADYFLKNNPEFEYGDVLLISGFEGARVRSIESVNTLKEIMKMYDASTEEIMQAYPQWIEANR